MVEQVYAVLTLTDDVRYTAPVMDRTHTLESLTPRCHTVVTDSHKLITTVENYRTSTKPLIQVYCGVFCAPYRLDVSTCTLLNAGF